MRAHNAERRLQQARSLTCEALTAVLEALQQDIVPGSTTGVPGHKLDIGIKCVVVGIYMGHACLSRSVR